MDHLGGLGHDDGVGSQPGTRATGPGRRSFRKAGSIPPHESAPADDLVADGLAGTAVRAGPARRNPLRGLPGADPGPGRGDRRHPGWVGADGGQPLLLRRPDGVIRMSGPTLAGPVDFITNPISDVVGGGAKAVAAQMLS